VAEAAIAEQLKAVEQRRVAWIARRAAARPRNAAVSPQDDPLQAALVSMDPATGHVRAMVGGRDFDASTFNRAVQAHRQPGSAFKPFVYATALEAGYSPATMINHLDDPVLIGRVAWTPEDGHSSGSAMSLRTALRTSSNRAA